MSATTLAKGACGLLAAATLLSGCHSKPEITGPAGSDQASDDQDLKTPAPPYPAWAAPYMGKILKQTSVASCTGHVDSVPLKFTGPVRPGATIEGWGWDEKAAKPLDRVLLLDTSGRVVGAAVVGSPRPDVMKVMPEVKTIGVGWKGVVGVNAGDIDAIGVTGTGASCRLGAISL